MSKITNFIKNIFTKIYTDHLKKTIFIIAVAIFAVFYFQGGAQKIEVGKMENGTIEETVSVSGTVTPSDQSSLSFQKSGRIENINVKTGNTVKAGQILASLSNGSDYASALSAQATLDQANANLQDVLNGASAADINLKTDLVNSAKSNLSNANNSFADTIRTINTSITDILKNKIGNFFTSNSGTYRLSFNTCDQNLSSTVETARANLDKDITNLNTEVNTFSLTGDDKTDSAKVDEAAEISTNVVKNTFNLLDNLNTLFTNSCSISDTSLDTQRNIISSARTNISNTLSSLNSAKSQIISYRNALSSANLSLDQLKSGATDQKIKSMRAQVDQARAGLLLAESNNKNNFLVAPFDGIITAVNINPGEISSPNANAVSLISASNLQLKIKLAEIDLVKVKVGDKARITLDTYGDGVIFDGVVTEVDPAATVTGGSSTYYAKIDFVQKDDRIKSGMNGTAEIITFSKENADHIDAKYLLINGSSSTVKIIKNISDLKNTTGASGDKNIELRNVETGVRTSKGQVEIISGLTKDDNLFPIGEEVLNASSTASK